MPCPPPPKATGGTGDFVVSGLGQPMSQNGAIVSVAELGKYTFLPRCVTPTTQVEVRVASSMPRDLFTDIPLGLQVHA